MSIQWFPGHMHSTRKAIAARMKATDVVIELLDARLPASSANPLLSALAAERAGVGRLMLLNKSDLADAARTTHWLAHYNSRRDTCALALDATHAPAQLRQTLIDSCRALAPGRGGLAKPMRVLVCGVPNVGKSTFINTLSAKRQAKTGDEAGMTRLEQRIVLADDFYLWDTPGMLWPRIDVPESGEWLAASGAVGRNAFDEESVALALLAYLKRHYAEPLASRFRIPAESTLAGADVAPGTAARAGVPPVPSVPASSGMAEIAAMADDALLDAIGRRRGALLPGARVDRQKAAEIVLTEFRSGGLGRITLEIPDEFAAWTATAAAAREAAEVRRQARKDQRVPPR
ncbi:MAG: ribosome biogenesis GTPase YlqF [Variovorax sp.]